MLKNCPECKGSVSDQAASCPHCGHPLAPAGESPANHRRAAIFTVLAALGLVLCLFTPRIILILPLLGTVACAVIALFRKERARFVPIAVIVLAAGLLILSASDSPSSATGNPASLASVKLEDWNWAADPEFGTRGSIVWNASVRNVSDKYVESVKVELTTYDTSGKLIASDFTYIVAIPPGEVRSKQSYADFYGTEENATAQVVDVRFAR